MKKKYKIVFLIIIQHSIFNIQSFSQTAPGIQWQNTIGGNDYDQLNSIQQTTDGGYILGGYSNSDSSGDKTEDNWDQTWHNSADYWVVKVDSLGNVEWENTIGGTESDQLWSIAQTSDGGYILGGDSKSNISGDKTENCLGFEDYWIVKLDAYGNIEWQNTIGGDDNDYCRSVKQTSDGGYIVGGYSLSDTTFDKKEVCIGGDDYWIVKLDSIGNIQWQNTIGGSNTDNLMSLKQTKDGGYILAGYSWSSISGDKTENNLGGGSILAGQDYWVIKVDSIGNIQWQNTIGGIKQDELWSAEQTFDGGYILSGWSTSDSSYDKSENNMGNGIPDYWVVKLDSAGVVQWENTIGGDQYDWLLGAIKQTLDGGYIVGGSSTTNISGDKTENNCFTSDFWLFKLDAFGNILWQNTIGGNGEEGINSLTQTFDGGYLLAGSSGSNISCDKTENILGSWDYWIVKLAPDTITSIIQFPHYQLLISISPNPITDKLNVSVNNKELSEIFIYDIASRKLLQQKFTNSISLNTEQLTKGLYLYEVRGRNGLCKKGKVIKD